MEPRVVALGDSITAGVGDQSVSQYGDGWAALVAHALGAKEYLCLARNGVRARDLAQTQVPDALMASPDLVIISVGGNDILRGDFDAREVESALADAVARLRRPGRSIVVLSIVAVALFDLCPARVRHVMTARVEQVNASIKAATLGTDVVVIDGARVAGAVGESMWHIDRIHPSPRGHRALAAEVLRLLPEQFKQTALLPSAQSAPNAATRLWWLASNGLPWLVKRSRDLIPQVLAAASLARPALAQSAPQESQIATVGS